MQVGDPLQKCEPEGKMNCGQLSPGDQRCKRCFEVRSCQASLYNRPALAHQPNVYLEPKWLRYLQEDGTESRIHNIKTLGTRGIRRKCGSSRSSAQSFYKRERGGTSSLSFARGDTKDVGNSGGAPGQPQGAARQRAMWHLRRAISPMTRSPVSPTPRPCRATSQRERSPVSLTQHLHRAARQKKRTQSQQRRTSAAQQTQRGEKPGLTATRDNGGNDATRARAQS